MKRRCRLCKQWSRVLQLIQKIEGMPMVSVGGWGRCASILFACVGLILHQPISQAAAATAIGGAERVVNDVQGFLGEITRVLQVADEVFTEEVIETSDDGATRIIFLDGTELTMGPNSRVTLDRYVYDPTSGAGEMAVSFVSGIFEFASGLLPDANYSLRTPFANLAIRGTVIRLMVRDDGMQVTVPEGEIEIFSGPVSLDLEGATSCIVWEEDQARTLPLEEACGELVGADPSFLGEIVNVREMPASMTTEEVVETGPEGGLRLVFIDGTEILLGASSSVTILRYAFDPATGEGSMAARFGAGAFEFISGRIPSANYDLESPFFKVEVRGTRVRGLVLRELQKVSVPVGAITLSKAGKSFFLGDELNCFRRASQGDGEVRLIEEACGALTSEVIVMSSLIGALEVAPGAGPQQGVQPINILTFPNPGRSGFTPPQSVSPTNP
jgi:hypothetical protein